MSLFRLNKLTPLLLTKLIHVYPQHAVARRISHSVCTVLSVGMDTRKSEYREGATLIVCSVKHEFSPSALEGFCIDLGLCRGPRYAADPCRRSAHTDPRLPTPAAPGDGAWGYLLLGANPESIQKHLVLMAMTNICHFAVKECLQNLDAQALPLGW